MARPRSTSAKTVKEFVQQQRSELYAAGHQNLNMSLAIETIGRIDEMKQRYGLRSRDAIVGRIIRKCMTTTDPSTFIQRAADPDTTFRRISPIVPEELVAYVKQVQLRFRNLAYGPVFEMILETVGDDLSIAPLVAESTKRAAGLPERSPKARTADPGIGVSGRAEPPLSIDSSCFRRPLTEKAA